MKSSQDIDSVDIVVVCCSLIVKFKFFEFFFVLIEIEVDYGFVTPSSTVLVALLGFFELFLLRII